MHICMMDQKGKRAVREFTSSVYRQFRMQVVILAAYANMEGDPSIALWVWGSIQMHISQP